MNWLRSVSLPLAACLVLGLTTLGCGSRSDTESAYHLVDVLTTPPSTPTPAMPFVDLEVAEVRFSSPLHSKLREGDTVPVTVSVHNAGNVSAGAFRVRVYESTDNTSSSSDRLLFEQAVSRLDGNRSVTVGTTLSVTRPAPSLAYVIVVVDDQNLVIETNTSNNTLAKPYQVVGAPDATRSTLDVSIDTVPVGWTPRLTAVLRDAHGATIPDERVVLELTGVGSLDRRDGPTDERGEFRATYTATTEGTASIRASAAGFWLGPVSITVTPANPPPPPPPPPQPPGPETWRSVSSGLEGAHVAGLAIDPQTPSTLYAATLDAGLFKTTDAGASWAPVGTATLLWVSVVVDPAQPQRVWAAGEGVHASTDGGATWTQASNGLPAVPVHALAIAPSDPQVLYAAHDQGVARTADGGTSWTPLAGGLPATSFACVAVDPTDARTAYAGTQAAGGVYKTTDGGATWLAAHAGLGTPQVHGLAIDPLTPSRLYAALQAGLYRSTDAGTSWTLLRSGECHTVAIDPVAPQVLYATEGRDKLQRSTDGGVSWSRASSGLVSDPVVALAIDPLTRSTLYAGTRASYGGVSQSTDSGTSWTPRSAGILRPVTAMASPRSGVVYVSMSGGDLPQRIFSASRPGGGWSSVAAYTQVRALAPDPLSTSTLYMALANADSVRVTTDGLSWSPQAAGLAPRKVHSLAVFGGSPSTLFAGTEADGVFRSLDAGASWSAPANAGLVGSVYALAVHPGQPATLYAGTTTDVFKTVDGGATWTSVLADPGLDTRAIRLDPLDPDTVYVVGRGRLAKSSDAGATWATLSAGLPSSEYHDLVLRPLLPRVLYLATATGVYRSLDRGASWQAMNSGLAETDVRRLAVDDTTSNGLYAGTARGVFHTE